LRTLGVAQTYEPAELSAAQAVVDSLAGLTVERLLELAGGGRG
jgi:hypothetical protein